MAGEVKVLLVSAGASPEALTAELRRLGVNVKESSFAEAEEAIETDAPDLVALAGALGAVELANIIDDLDDGPRMVIVAERKELAKLRGLNREVVVSLFAMETTEKVVGQRIESLARRAARRNEQKAAPDAALPQKTALGLPSGVVAAAAFAKVTLKRPPGVARPPIVESVPPPSSGNHPGAEPPTPEPAPVVEEKEPVSSQRSDEDPSSETKFTIDERGTDSALVMDEDLLESISPHAPDGPPVAGVAIPTLSNIPLISAAPEPDEVAVSNPPTLPPEAKAQSSRIPNVALAAPPGDLDISHAENALDNLDSVKLDLTPDILAHAKKGLDKKDDAPAPPDLGDDEFEEELEPDELEPDELLSVGPETIPPGAVDEDSEGHNDVEAPAPDLGMANTLPLKASRPDAAIAEAKAQAAKKAPAPVASEAPPSIPGAKRVKGGSGKALGLLAALVAAGAAAMALNLGGSAKPEQNAGGVAPASAPKPSVDESESDAERREKAPKSTDETPAAEDAPAVEPEPREDDKPGPSLDNPFRVPDTNKPSCDSLLKAGMPTPGKDPVSEASQIWSEAREAIVSGKLDEANLLMCQAVALFPESAAIEGLAAHYLAEGSLAQALAWVDKADAVRPDQRDMGNLRGDIYAMMGDIEKAREAWLKTLNISAEEKSRIAPVSKDYSVEAGRHLRRGDIVRAELFFRRAVILDMDNLTGIVGLAKVYHRLEKPRYARAFCEMSIKVSDMIPEVHVLLGELALAEGNKSEAKERFERALAVRPGFFPAKRGLSLVQ